MKNKPVELAKPTEFFSFTLWFLGYASENKITRKKSKEYWKFEKRSFQKMRPCVDSRTCRTMRRGQLRLETARMVVPTCQTQWFFFFSGCGWLPRSSYGKDRCLRKSILVGLTDESNRRARQRVRDREKRKTSQGSKQVVLGISSPVAWTSENPSSENLGYHPTQHALSGI